MNKLVRIQTGSRLHFGVLSYHPDSSRHFGGVGMMIDQPGFQVELQKQQTDQNISRTEFLENLNVRSECSMYAERTRKMIQHYLESVDQQELDFLLKVNLDRLAPSHEGFGSGTQLGMSLSQGLSLLLHDSPQPVREELAKRVSRGARSSLGIHGFMEGGFLLDGGKSDPSSIGVLVARHHFPEDWRIVLARVKKEKGISGQKETEIFSTLKPMPEAMNHQLCRIALMDLFPSLLSRDFPLFSRSLFEFGSLVGDFFSSVQGGRFASPVMTDWIEFLKSQGVEGIAQSSWGPACAVICSSQQMAEQIVSDCSGEERWDQLSFGISAGFNHGAVIEFE